MILISLITAALLTGSFGKGFTDCSFYESKETSCFTAAGKSVHFYQFDKYYSGISLVKDDKDIIFKTDKNGKIKFNQRNINTDFYFINGTIKLNNVSKKDAGVYTLQEHNSEGKKLRTSSIQMKVLAPVSVLTVSQQCLSPEQQKVTCFYEGDEAELTLTFNGFSLLPSNKHSQSLNRDTSNRSSVFNVSIIIHGHLLGDITCKVWNDVSRDETVKTITACNGSQSVSVATFPTFAAVAAFVSLLLLAALIAALIKLCRKQRAAAVNAGDADPDVIYTEVKVRKKKRKTEAGQQHGAQP